MNIIIWGVGKMVLPTAQLYTLCLSIQQIYALWLPRVIVELRNPVDGEREVITVGDTQGLSLSSTSHFLVCTLLLAENGCFEGGGGGLVCEWKYSIILANIRTGHCGEGGCGITYQICKSWKYEFINNANIRFVWKQLVLKGFCLFIVST